MNEMVRTSMIYCDTCRRLREILRDAPWSSFDLLSSLIVLGVGGYFIIHQELFQRFDGLYRMFSEWGSEGVWGALFVSCGTFGLAMVGWPSRPSFGLRLLARMAVSFCLITVTINHFGTDPPTAGVITNGVLSIAATWGILRTRRYGR